MCIYIYIYIYVCIYIYIGESVSPGEFFKNVSKATSLPVFVPAKKRYLGDTNLKLGIHTQLASVLCSVTYWCPLIVSCLIIVIVMCITPLFSYHLVKGVSSEAV